MAKQTASAGRGADHPSRDDVLRIVGAVDDETAAEILALNPTIADLEIAALRAAGTDEPLREHPPLGPVAAAIFDILVADEEDEPARLK